MPLNTKHGLQLTVIFSCLQVPILIAQHISHYVSTFQNLNQSEYVLGNCDWNARFPDLINSKNTTSISMDSIGYSEDWANSSPFEALAYSDLVADYSKLYQRGTNAIYLQYLLDFYLPHIAPLIKQLGLPEFLAVIPAVSSGFDPFSVNVLGGTGYWNLNYPQALKYGLDVTASIDYRKDFEQSTRAALQYLKDLKEQYPDWELTLAAYACGPITVNNLLNRNSATSYLEIYEGLPGSTRDIVPAVAALYWLWLKTKSAVKEPTFQYLSDTVRIMHKMEFKAIEKVAGIPEQKLRYFNPVVNGDYFPENFTALVPKGEGNNLKGLRDSIYTFQDSVLHKPLRDLTEKKFPANSEPISYRVKSGDVLGRIAEKFGVRVSEIQDWNNLRTTRIALGQELLIYSNKPAQKSQQASKPTTTLAVKENQKKTATRTLGDYITYTVRSGENLWIIAKKFPGISAQNIMDLNGIDENLQVGQVLKIKLKQ